MFLHALHQQIWLLAMGLTCGFALWRGGRPERLAALACATAWIISVVVYNYRNWVDPQWSVLGVDVALLAALIGLTLTTDRVWLLFASAFQLLGVVIHIAIMADPKVTGLPYIRGLVIWSYLVIFALAWGVWSHWRTTRQADTDAAAPARR